MFITGYYRPNKIIVSLNQVSQINKAPQNANHALLELNNNRLTHTTGPLVRLVVLVLDVNARSCSPNLRLDLDTIAIRQLLFGRSRTTCNNNSAPNPYRPDCT